LPEEFRRHTSRGLRIYWIIVGAASTSLFVAIGVPGVATAFRLAVPSIAAVLIAAIATVSGVLSCGWLLRNRY